MNSPIGHLIVSRQAGRVLIELICDGMHLATLAYTPAAHQCGTP